MIDVIGSIGVYTFAARRASAGSRKHVISGSINPDGTFRTACGIIGMANQHPWVVGQMHTGRAGWCRRCRR